MSLQFLADYSSSSKHDAPIWAIASTSKVLWSASADGCIKAWDASTGRELNAVRIKSPHRNAITSLSLSEAQGMLISGSLDGSLALWDVAAFEKEQQGLPKVEGLMSTGLEQEPTEEKAAADAESQEQEQPIPRKPDAKEAGASRDELAPLAYVDSVARLTFPNAEGKLATIPIDAYVSDLHPSAPILATSGNTAAISLYTVDSSSSSSSFLTPLRRFRADAVIRPKHTAGASLSAMRTPQSEGLSGSKKGWGMVVRFSPIDGRLVAVGTDSGQVIVHSTETGDVIASFSNHSAPIRSIRFSLAPSAYSAAGSTSVKSAVNGAGAAQAPHRLDHIVIGSDDRTLTLHDARDIEERGDAASDQVVTMLQGHAGRVLDASIRPDGRITASTSADKTIKLWDLLTSPKMCVCTIGEEEKMWMLHWLDDARFVAAGDQGIVKWYRGAGVVTTAGEEF